MLSRVNYSLTQLEYVAAVYRMGHFGRAATACRVTQPTLSMQLRKLEESLGVVIFDRAKKPVLLTEVGRKLMDQISAILHESRQIESIIRANQGRGLHGQLVVGIIPSIAPYLLPRLLPVLETRSPGVELKIRELQTHRIVEALGDDAVDVGILATPLKIPRVHEMPLYYERFSILCRKGHALTARKAVKHSALKGDDLWLLEEGHCLRNQVLNFCELKPRGSAARRFQLRVEV